ncbi:MAG TPA: hypothetical protein VLM42_00595 [Bryobacteraceae bacterium]|nr:hypothetical protein [Bryobacteraceae bacterium]
MRRVTITLSDEIEASLNTYLQQQRVSAPLTAIMQAALQEFLSRQGFTTSVGKLRITPAKKGSRVKDASVDHNRYLAD